MARSRSRVGSRASKRLWSATSRPAGARSPRQSRFCKLRSTDRPLRRATGGEEQIGAVDLYTVSWPDVRREIEAGRDTIVLALGAVEQHGHHLPLGTDSIFGDE